MTDNDDFDNDQLTSMVAEKGMVETLHRGDIDQQIATAHKYPRSVKHFMDQMLQMACYDEQTAGECKYALPRKERDQTTGKMVTKFVEGPSARFAELVASAWGNCRAGARTIDDTGKFVTAQGLFHDLQRNVAITMETQRRITNKEGRRFNDDMVGVTANAACSIALRNAILRGVPKVFWRPAYEEACRTALGDVATLAKRRDAMLAHFQKMGVTNEHVFALLGVAGALDITLDHLGTMKGIATSIKEDGASVDAIFPNIERAGADVLNERLKDVDDGGKESPEKVEQAQPEQQEPQSDPEPQPAAPAARKPRTKTEKPPTQTISGASLGDTSSFGTPGATAAEPEAKPAPAADDFFGNME